MTKVVLILGGFFLLSACGPTTQEMKAVGSQAGSPTPAPKLTVLSSPTYEVYPGCEAPSDKFKRKVFIDPASGTALGDGSAEKPMRTLAEAVAAKKIKSGDHVVLLPGDHGVVTANKYNNPLLQNSPEWIWIDFQPGATAKAIYLRHMSRWLITHAEISSIQATLVAFTDGMHFVLADSHLYSDSDANVSHWTAADWINLPSQGVGTRNGVCASILRNSIENVRFGIGIASDLLTVPENSVKNLVQDNEIKRFSADGMRPNGTDITLRRNKILDAYASSADGDGNHDDGIQMFAMNGAVYDNILIDENWVQESTDTGRAFNASLQGIAVFDGLLTNLRITRNVVLVSAYHGIAAYGVKDSLIQNNTVANPSNGIAKTWIYVPASKTGVAPVNTLVKNNIAHSISGAGTGVVFGNNYLLKSPESIFEVFNRLNAVFDLRPKADSPIAGKNIGYY